MREYAAPLPTTIPTTGNLTDDVVANARDAGETAVFSRRTADGWVDVTAREFHDEVRGVAKGLIAAGVEAGDRVALLSKTRYEWTLLDYAIWSAGAVSGPDLRDLQRRADRLDPPGLRCQRGGRRRPRPPRTGARGTPVRRPAPSSSTSGRSRTTPSTWSRGRLGRPRRPPRAPDVRRPRRRPRHADLHQRHHRPAQGLRAHPRQLHVRARHRHRELGDLFDAEAPRRCSSSRSRTSSPGSSRSAACKTAPGWATAPTSRTSSPTSASSSRPSCSPCPASSRRSSTPPRSVPPPTVAARSSTAPPTSPSRGPARRTARGCPCGCAPSTPSSTGSSTASCARRSAAAARTPSPAARRWVNASGTSTTASA